MHLDQKVTVICTDNDSKSNGKIIRIFPTIMLKDGIPTVL